MFSVRHIAAVSVLALALGCQRDSASISAPVNVTVPSASDPAILANHGPLFAANGAPAIANPVVSFWATKGTAAQVFMYFLPRLGHADSSDFIRFRIPKQGLLTYPNGQPFQNGDSVLITMTLTNAVHLVVEFQPAGLAFDPSHPASLRLSYLETDPDIDRDGDVDAVDLALQAKVRIWKKDPPAPWMRLVGSNNQSLEEVESDVTGFTSYALAY